MSYDWRDKLGDNIAGTDGYFRDRMIEKNLETGGSYQASVSGMYGEFTIAAVFKSLPDQYHVMNDILLQLGTKYRLYNPNRYGESPFRIVQNRGRLYEEVKMSTQIDHVIVSPYGLFVIETKNHKGWVFGDVAGQVWTQVLVGGRAKYTFYNPVRQNEGHMVNLSKQLGLGRQFMTGMIVFTNPEAYLGNVNCNCCYTVDMLYDAIISYDNPVWTMQQTEKVIHAIEKIDTNNYTGAKEHEMYVKDIKRRHDINRGRF